MQWAGLLINLEREFAKCAVIAALITRFVRKAVFQ